MYFENLTKQYELSKTLRFNLIPQGKTLENIKNDNIIEADKFRKENAVVVKKYINSGRKRDNERIYRKIYNCRKYLYNV